MKKINILVILCLCIFMPSVNAQEIKLIDIKGHWAEENINLLIKKEIISGYSDNTFKPDNNISIIEFLKILIETGEYKLIRNGNNIYPDFYYETAIFNKLIFENEYEDLNSPLTRYEMAKIISNYVKIDDVSSSKNKFKDLDKEYANYVLKLQKLKIINGYKDKTFRGENFVTRAEAVKVICKTSEISEKIFLNREYDITLRNDLSNYKKDFSIFDNEALSIKTFYEIRNKDILIYDYGRYADLNGYKVSSEYIDLNKVIKIIKKLVNEKAYVTVIYTPSKYTIGELKILYGDEESNVLCGKYDFSFNYYESDTYHLAAKSLNNTFSNNCYIRIDLINIYNEKEVDEYKKKKLLDALTIEFGSNAPKILKYMLEKNEKYILNVEREVEHAEKRVFGKYIVNFYQKEYGIPQFYIERK